MRFTTHLDEKTPHIHAVIVPIKDGRLTAKEVLGNPQEIVKKQDQYAQAMRRFGLERGQRNSKARHTSA